MKNNQVPESNRKKSDSKPSFEDWQAEQEAKRAEVIPLSATMEQMATFSDEVIKKNIKEKSELLKRLRRDKKGGKWESLTGSCKRSRGQIAVYLAELDATLKQRKKPVFEDIQALRRAAQQGGQAS